METFLRNNRREIRKDCGAGYNRGMRIPSRPAPGLIAGTLIVIAFGAGVALSYLQTRHGDPAMVEGLLWPDPPIVGPVYLLDHNSAPFTLEHLRGKWSLLFFGFTSCPDICPTTLQKLARAHEELKSHGRYRTVGQVVFVSVDPERDSPETLREYVHYFHEDFIGVTAAVEELEGFARKLGVLFMKVPQGSDDYSVDHSAGIFLIDPALRLVSVVTPPHSTAAIVRRFDKISAYIDSTL
jgi:protein SCO1